ncbi:TonB-dependent siderophore receptor [Aquabacterium sp.]|uniref:TonB-dependent receptor plug domain-containing protein n=1 Tax=Aquabacterium sp. TaxID=1872578 RepID=UPI0027B95542|nr:TonB-dependent receptor [Aquabacterium sp.]
MVSLSALCVRRACHRLVLGLALGGFTAVSVQAAGRAPTEEDYFANVPVVLTASRLDQPLNEAPGAITVIDRQTIRLSGARTLAEVMRLVPGYLSGGWNGANPLAAYHIPLDDFGTRNLVLIDGRSVYASSYLGDTHRGMMDVMLEDIERIEVLRGANSAAYGANAMFGVINIITRHSADTVGGEVSLTSGDNGIRDRRARIGVGDETASFRLSVGEQRDSGYLNAYDDKRLGQVNARADFKPTLNDDVMVAMGVSYLDAGEGDSDNENPLHKIRTRDTHFQGEWRRQLGEADELKVSASYMEDTKKDFATAPNDRQNRPTFPIPGAFFEMDYGGIGRRVNLEVQRKASLSDSVRAVIGLGFKDERARSAPLYNTHDWVSFRETRAFGTVEWRASAHWLFNGGLFVGDHSRAGTYTAPRLMANWLLSPEHTVRFGVTESIRAPNLYEYEADTRTYTNVGAIYVHEYAATGRVQPETLLSKELGYVGRFKGLHLTLDARLYHERMRDVIGTTLYPHPETNPLNGRRSRDYVNRTNLSMTGLEYQLRWKPLESTEVWLNQSFTRLEWDDPKLELDDERRPPEHTTLIALFQRLPGNLQLGVIHERVGGMTWRARDDWMPFTHRTDLRLAYSFRIGASRAEAALTVQSAEGAGTFFRVQENFKLARKSFLTLRVEM